MAPEFAGKIELDIRDSAPDWAPYLAPKAPEGAPNVVFIVWDDVGYGTMDCFGGPVHTPTMRRIADRGVRYSNFHTTALCSPTRASLLTGRNATSNGMATIAEFSSGFPGISTRIPFENGFISEVLVEHGYNTYCVGKWHLTPGEETGMAAWKKRWPLGRGFERFYGFLGGESSCWYPDLVHDNHPIEPPATPAEGYHIAKDLSDKAIEFIRDAKVIEPDKPFFLYFSLDAAHAPHHVFTEWADKYKGTFDDGYEAIRDDDPGPAEGARAAARRHRAERHQPARRARGDRPRRAALAAARHGAPVGVAERRREAPVHPDGRGVRRLRRVHRRPGRPGHRLPRDVRPARQHHHRRRSPTTARAVRAAPTAPSTSGASSTACPTPTELSLEHIDELGGPESYNHYNTGWAWAFDTPFPYWKRWAGLRGRHRRHVPGVVAGQGAPPTPPCARSTCTRSTSCRRSTT